MSTITINGAACLVADLGSDNAIDFDKLRAATWNSVKCEGVILRCTRSNCQLDKKFSPRFAAAKEAGFLVGAYAFNTGETAKAQSDRFLGAIKSCGEFLCAIDFEHNPSGGQMTLSTLLEWLDRVDQATGRRAWLYSGNWIKTFIVQATDAQRSFLAEHALWGCEYGPTFKLVDDKNKPLPWPKATLWQFTGDGVGPEPQTLAGLQAGADLSLFNGTRADLEQVWAGAPMRAPVVASTDAATDEG